MNDKIALDEKELAKVSGAFGMEARFDAIPGRTFPVKLKEFVVQADVRTKTYPVTVTLPQPEGARVLPGMAVTVTVDFSGGTRRNVFLVPESAILGGEADGPTRSVWLYRDGTVTLVPVTVNEWRNGMIEISSAGLAAGGRIVTAGVHFLREGQKVRILSDIATAEFARMCMLEAYKAGSTGVTFEWSDEKSE